MVGKNENKFNFLVFEDNPIFRKGLTAILERIGHVDQVDQKKNAENLIKERKYDIAFIDLFIGDDLEGLDLVTLTKENNTYAVVLSSCQDMEIIEKAYKRGCNDCLSKTNYREHIDAILAKFQSSNQNKLNDVLKSEYVTQDAGIIASLERLVECNDFDRAIFLSGPSGVGKTQIARAIHKLAGGSEENFVNLNCSCTNDDLLESEMFGHVEGAFTGADCSKNGKLRMANGGTLFLDEIASMPISIQAKLLKALEEKEFYPLGSDIPVKSNFRVISASWEDLPNKIKDGSFRQDLYYRINARNIHISPLKQRKMDIFLLIDYFINKNGRHIILTDDVKSAFNFYPWPGNIRELKHVTDGLLKNTNGIIELADVPQHIINYEETDEDTTGRDIAQYITSEQYLDFKKHGFKELFNKIKQDIAYRVYLENNKKLRPTLQNLKMNNNTFKGLMMTRENQS